MHTGETWRLGRRPGLDGLRGIAIALVVIAHARIGGDNNGGSIGVTVFFALSGFLITSLLLEERARTGRVSLRGFYARRARRLLPALVVYLAFWLAVWSLGLSPLPVPLAEVAVVMLYMTNVLMVFAGASQVTGITWSLSVEEQFYLLWPLTFLLLRRWPRAQNAVAVWGIVVAIAWRLVVWHGPAPDSWWPIYYSSFGHMDSLLVGCLLAIGIHCRPAVLKRTSPLIGWAGVATLTALMLSQDPAVKYIWEPMVAALAGCTVIVAVLTGGSRWLAWAPLRWLGRRSYALYLWHYPLTVLASPGLHVFPMWVAVGLSLVAAEVSWWVVERPGQRFGRRWATWRRTGAPQSSRPASHLAA